MWAIGIWFSWHHRVEFGLSSWYLELHMLHITPLFAYIEAGCYFYNIMLVYNLVMLVVSYYPILTRVLFFFPVFPLVLFWTYLSFFCISLWRYAAVFAAFVAGMACLVGIDFSAKLLASLAKSFEVYLSNLAKNFFI